MPSETQHRVSSVAYLSGILWQGNVEKGTFCLRDQLEWNNERITDRGQSPKAFIHPMTSAPPTGSYDLRETDLPQTAPPTKDQAFKLRPWEVQLILKP